MRILVDIFVISFFLSIFAAMIEALTIYHGSNVAVEKPQIFVSGFYKDFGYGFYCTNIEKLASITYERSISL